MMKTRNLCCVLIVAVAGCMALVSCHDDDDMPSNRKLRQIEISGEIEIAGKMEMQRTVMTLEYDADDRLVEYRETSGEMEQTFTLAYADNKVTVNREGEYYGEYTLNSQGYAESFARPYTNTYYYSYSDEGYLLNSTFGTDEWTFSYEHGNVTRVENPGHYYVLFTPSVERDNFAKPAFYQPVYLHIPGNVEVKFGYLAGLYGKLSYNLTAETVTVIGEGKPWGYQVKVEYTYEMDKGYVFRQKERTQADAQGTRFTEGLLTFTYDD